MTVAHRPRSLSEALSVLADETVVPVAGCTDLMVVDRATDRQHAGVCDLSLVPELHGSELKDGWFDFGAATTFSELRENADVVRQFPILHEMCGTIGGWQIQNRGTIGGNIANASPAGDSLPVLLALDAELVLAGADGRRKVRYSEMHRGYKKTKLRKGELIVRVRLPVPRPAMVQRFRKVGTRQAQAISKVVVAFTADLEHGALYNVRLAAGSVADRPVRLKKAEKACEGKPATLATADEIAALARSEVTPIDDVRSTAEYRTHVLGTVVRRMILDVGASG